MLLRIWTNGNLQCLVEMQTGTSQGSCLTVPTTQGWIHITQQPCSFTPKYTPNNVYTHVQTLTKMCEAVLVVTALTWKQPK